MESYGRTGCDNSWSELRLARYIKDLHITLKYVSFAADYSLRSSADERWNAASVDMALSQWVRQTGLHRPDCFAWTAKEAIKYQGLRDSWRCVIDWSRWPAWSVFRNTHKAAKEKNPHPRRVRRRYIPEPAMWNGLWLQRLLSIRPTLLILRLSADFCAPPDWAERSQRWCPARRGLWDPCWRDKSSTSSVIPGRVHLFRVKEGDAGDVATRFWDGIVVFVCRLGSTVAGQCVWDHCQHKFDGIRFSLGHLRGSREGNGIVFEVVVSFR